MILWISFSYLQVCLFLSHYLKSHMGCPAINLELSLFLSKSTQLDYCECHLTTTPPCHTLRVFFFSQISAQDPMSTYHPQDFCFVFQKHIFTQVLLSPILVIHPIAQPEPVYSMYIHWDNCVMLQISHQFLPF